LRHPQQIATVRSQSLPPSQSNIPLSTQQKPFPHQVPPVAVVPPSPKKSLPSLQIKLTSDEKNKNIPTLTSDEKKKNVSILTSDGKKKIVSSKIKLPNTTGSTSKPIIETMNSESKQYSRPSATVLVGGGSRSAFRPFLKPTPLNPQVQIPLNINVKSQISTNQFIQK